MKQFELEIHENTDLSTLLADVKRAADARSLSAILVHIYAGSTDRTYITEVMRRIRENLPEAMIVGCSSGGEISRGQSVPQSILAVITLFESTEVRVQTWRFAEGEEKTAGAEIGKQIDETPGIKAAELLADSWKFSSTALFEEINKCNPDVQIFGTTPYAHDVRDPMFLIYDGEVDTVTVILITYAGEEFYITTDYVIGWKPMGIPMTVTKADGTLLYELDHKPAYEIYKKYLDIADETYFIENAFEFPFVRYAQDIYMLRMPFSLTEDGALSLVAPVEEGDTLYLSYGDISVILNEIHNAVSELNQFAPQYIYLFDCATRKTFWKKHVNDETSPFQKLAQTSGIFCGGEILRTGGHLIHFNSTLSIVAMREGKAGKPSLRRLGSAGLVQSTEDRQTTMIRRMAHFITTAMEELHEDKTDT